MIRGARSSIGTFSVCFVPNATTGWSCTHLPTRSSWMILEKEEKLVWIAQKRVSIHSWFE